MKTSWLLLLVGGLLWTTASKACDVCGCNLSGVYFGFSGLSSGHFIGVNYQYASFRAAIDNDGYYFKDEWSHDVFHRMEVAGRFRISDRWQVRVGLPLVRQQMAGTSQNVTVMGLADPILSVHFNPINTVDEMSSFVHSLTLGAGVKMPLGKFELEDAGQLINPNFQPGTGSWDALAMVSYTLRWENLGWSTEGTAKINSANSLGYRVGNQFNATSQVFYFLETPWGSWVPQLGGQFENGAAHRRNDLIVGNTGGSACLATWGLQFFRNQWGLSVQHQIPVWQQFITDANVSLAGGERWLVQAIYNLPSKN